MITTRQSIAEVYKTFNAYTAANMNHCDCGCIDLNDVKRLASKKLRDLEDEDLAPYHGSALYTWGDVEHYKHFLPRILEVYSMSKGRGLIGLEEIVTKLKYAQWDSWNGNEVVAIKNFFLADWREFVNERTSNINRDDITSYLYFFQMSELLRCWNLSQGKIGLRNFVYFFYDYGNEILSEGLRIQGRMHEREWKNALTAQNILELLENEFFECAHADSVYSTKISVVMQMIEQEKKLGW